MGFWMFMTVSNLMIPALMLLIGKIFLKHPPKTINGVYGYRTSMSMKNQETWDFAHQYCGRLWLKIGRVMLAFSFLIMLPLTGKGENAIGIAGSIIMTAECAALLAAIFPVERALKKNFDREGNRKNEKQKKDDEV